MIEFKIVEVIKGKFGGVNEGDVKGLPVMRWVGLRIGFEGDQQAWSTEKVGDAFVVFVPRLDMEFEEVVSNPFDLRLIEAAELDWELRDLKFVMDACQRPIAGQYAMKHVWAHVEKHKIDRLGGFLSTYVGTLYLRKKDVEPFAIYDYVAKVGKRASSSPGLPFMIGRMHTRSYSSRVSDDSLATYILSVLKRIRFLEDLEKPGISHRQSSSLFYQANHILNLTRKERVPSNWARLLRIRKRPEIQEEIEWMARFRKGLPAAKDESARKLHQRIDALISRFSVR